jgi:hypothetical protein
LASFKECIDIAINDKRISADVARQILSADDQNAAIDDVLGNLSRQRREASIQAVRTHEAYSKMESHPKGLYQGLVSLMTKDMTGQAGYKNIEFLGKYYEGKYHSMFAEAMSHFRTRMLGFSQDEEGLNKLVKAIYGETIDDPKIQQFAKEWLEVTDVMRADFNARGGSISKNERWFMPQHHDARAIEKMGLEEWKTYIRPLLDTNFMFDDAGQPLTKQGQLFDQVDEALDSVFETITTHGLNKVKDLKVPRLGKKLSRKGSERRFLYFKDADSWIAYQNKFGRGDVFTTLTDHINSMANDVSLMEVFGPNPENTFRALKTKAESKKALTNRQKYFSESIYNVVSGKVNQGELTGVSDFMQTTRNLLTSAFLGKAFLSAISDTGFEAITANYNNIPAFKVVSRKLSLLNPSNKADRIFATKIGLISENAMRASSGNRYSDIYGTGMSTKIAEGVMRASLLQPWTEMGRKAFGMEFSSMLADNFGKSLDQLDDDVKRAFNTYGIKEKDWDLFRSSKPLDYKGAKFADMLEPGGVKFHQMIMSETDYAVPMPDARVKAITTGGLGRGTIEGQGWRSVMMLKSFPLTIANTHIYRALFEASNGQKIQYTGLLLASTTVLGGIALTAKDIAAGREPRSMDNPKFFAAALVQGGGLGILGDYAFSDVNRFGGGIVSTAFGPTGQLTDDIVKLTLGNLQEAIRGEETNVLGESARFAERYTPDIWQTHLLKNALFDQIEMLADPHAQKKYNRIVRKRQKDYEQGYWWKPGEPLPEAMQ